MYHYFLKWNWNIVFLLLANVIGLIYASKNGQGTQQQLSIHENSTHLNALPPIDKQWKGLRVFADTSMLISDSEACDRAGKYVRVGKPQGDMLPVCSGAIINDCWMLCEDQDVLSAEKAEYINEILVPVVNWFKSVVKVKRVAGNIVIPKKAVPIGCADHLSLPNYYSKEGIKSTDLILIVTGRPTPTNTVAWATECASDLNGRPVFGHINIGPGELEDFENQKQYIYKVLLHELTHVIGFNSYKFPFYRDFSGNLYKSVTKTQVINGKRISKIITPNVLAAAREHFQCDDMDGVPLEDGGDSSTSDSHWEKRIFRNEYMTGSSDHTAVISKITLALLDDTGWYRVDYSHAEHFSWGKGMGCNFVNNRCSEWKNEEYFCTQTGTKGCTHDRTAMGACNLVRHRSSLSNSVQYFPDSNVGGNDALADYCPYVAAYTNGICSDSGNQPANPVFGERFSENSKCFESSLVKDGHWKKPNTQPMCYDYRCIENEKEGMKLEVKIGNTWNFCPFGGIVSNVSGFSGNLACPDSSFCSERTINTRHYEMIEEESTGSVSSPFSFLYLFIQIPFFLLLL